MFRCDVHTSQSSTLYTTRIYIRYMALQGALNQRLCAAPVTHIAAWSGHPEKHNCWFQWQNTQILITCIFPNTFFAILHQCRCSSIAHKSHLLQISMVILRQGKSTNAPHADDIVTHGPQSGIGSFGQSLESFLALHTSSQCIFRKFIIQQCNVVGWLTCLTDGHRFESCSIQYVIYYLKLKMWWGLLLLLSSSVLLLILLSSVLLSSSSSSSSSQEFTSSCL
jgi:hypothetical protein